MLCRSELFFFLSSPLILESSMIEEHFKEMLAVSRFLRFSISKVFPRKWVSTVLWGHNHSL